MQFPRYEQVVPLHGHMPRQPPRYVPRLRPVRPKRRRPQLSRLVRRARRPQLDVHQYLELEFSVDERR